MKNYLALVTAGMLAVSCGQPTSPGIEAFPDMIHSVAYEAYSENPVTGQTNLLPPAGTVARDRMPYPYANSPEGAAQAEKELVNPVPVSDFVVARGQKVFQNYCQVCHGVGGEGDGPIIPKFPNPPTFKSELLMGYNDGRLYHIVSVGGGGGIMPSYKEQIRENDRWAVVHYVKKLQGRL